MTDILKIDVASHVAAVAYSAAERVAELLHDDAQGLQMWITGGLQMTPADLETAVQALGNYVTIRPAPVFGEQLFNRARELDLHRMGPWAEQSELVRSAYAVFADTGASFKASLLAAQARAAAMAQHGTGVAAAAGASPGQPAAAAAGAGDGRSSAPDAPPARPGRKPR